MIRQAKSSLTPRPMLRLSVREITSVSTTFILSSKLVSPTDPSLSSLGLTDPSPSQFTLKRENEEEEEDYSKSNNEESTDIIANTTGTVQKFNRESSPPPPPPVSCSLIADALSKGLSVTVNGSAWSRTFIRIDEHLDEAVIIIYALMPGRLYDIELGLAACQNINGHEQDQHERTMGDCSNTRTLRRQITTHGNEIYNNLDSPTFEDESTPSSSSSSSLLSSPSTSTPPTSSSFITPPLPPSQPSPTTRSSSSSSPPPPPIQSTPTLPERLTQLHQSLSHLSTERDTLLTSLKSLRRESQKADASLRAEIDTLKRTFDKNASFELRSRQKLLALQESVKRAHNAARESEEMTREVEGEILELTKRKEEKENEHRMMEDEAGRMRRERGEVEEKERKRVEGMRGGLNGLTIKLERLNTKRERMEAMVIPDLEAKVEDIEGEIEDAEREVVNLEKESRLTFEETFISYHHPHQQQQQQPSPLWGPPFSSSATSSSSTPTRTHNPRSHSVHTYPSIHRRSSLKNTSTSMSMSLGTRPILQQLPPPPSVFFIDQPQHTSPISPSSPPRMKGSTKSSPSLTVNVPDPLAVGAGRPSRRSFESTVRKTE